MTSRRSSALARVLWIVVLAHVFAAMPAGDGDAVAPAAAPTPVAAGSAGYFPDQPRTGFVDALADFLDLVIPQALAVSVGP